MSYIAHRSKTVGHAYIHILVNMGLFQESLLLPHHLEQTLHHLDLKMYHVTKHVHLKHCVNAMIVAFF